MKIVTEQRSAAAAAGRACFGRGWPIRMPQSCEGLDKAPGDDLLQIAPRRKSERPSISGEAFLGKAPGDDLLQPRQGAKANALPSLERRSWVKLLAMTCCSRRRGADCKKEQTPAA
jgi:hypothetical protein